LIASNPNLRKIFYQPHPGVPIRVLSELTRCIREEYGRGFVFSGISRLCSFYLSGKDYAKEQEIRALHRVWEGIGPPPKDEGAYPYVEIPLNVPNVFGYQMKVTEVHSATEIDMPDTYRWTRRGAWRPPVRSPYLGILAERGTIGCGFGPGMGFATRNGSAVGVPYGSLDGPPGKWRDLGWTI
jgi:hypothetical protein